MISSLPQHAELSLQLEPGQKSTYLHQPEQPQSLTITIGEAAELTVYSFSRSRPSDLPLSSFLQQRTITLSQDAKLTWVEIVAGSPEIHNTILLQGPGAAVEQKQLFFASGTEQPVLLTRISHNASHTTSSLVAKGILDGTAVGKIQGTMSISSQSAGCIAQEKMNVLLLSKEARCDALPILDVANDDVQASHGAAIGRLDREQLFYLMSRGLAEPLARRLIIEGFIGHILSAIPEEIKSKVAMLMEERWKE